MQLKTLFTSLCLFANLVASTNHPPGNFTHDDKNFLLNGKPFQILGGQMDPQRVPHEYWRQRLQMARSMGINTIFSYVFWNNLETAPGTWNFQGRNDIALFARMVQEEGLYMVLRPGPYVCAEHEWGGFPAWLAQVPGMRVRSASRPFLDATRGYMQRLGAALHDQQVTRGGPILMVQLENEYGSFVAQSRGALDPADRQQYLAASAAILRDAFDLLLYTNDGASDELLAGGTLSGVLAEIDGETRSGFAALDRLADPTMKGPKLNGELYVTWLDHWGDGTRRGGLELDLAALLTDIDYIISNGHSFNLFMFHGGTSWGYDNGANRAKLDVALQPQVTSYDYGAVLDESGRPTETYHALRKLIASHVGESNIPAVPSLPGRSAVAQFTLKPAAALFDVQKHTYKKRATQPITMEELGQNYGYVLYEHNLASDVEGVLTVGDMPRDRVLVYINGVRRGIIDATYYPPTQVTVSLTKGDVLRLFVENMGRVNFQYPVMLEQTKGIVGNVTVGSCEPLEDWTSYSMPLERVSHGLEGAYGVQKLDGPVFYTGSFQSSGKADLGGDTFLTVPAGVKGQVWVNGKLLGKYWTRGWQQSLYVPGAWLKQDNEAVVLELEPSPDVSLSADGVSQRTWALGVDPDAPVW